MARQIPVALPVLLLLFVVLVPSAATAQTTTATLQGSVSDQSQAILPGATVTLRDVNTGFVRTTTSDREGRYLLLFVPAGTYALSVELAGFKTLQREGLRFEIGQEITIDVALEISTLAEVVTVRQETPPIPRRNPRWTRSSAASRSTISRSAAGRRSRWRCLRQAWCRVVANRPPVGSREAAPR